MVYMCHLAQVARPTQPERNVSEEALLEMKKRTDAVIEAEKARNQGLLDQIQKLKDEAERVKRDREREQAQKESDVNKLSDVLTKTLDRVTELEKNMQAPVESGTSETKTSATEKTAPTKPADTKPAAKHASARDHGESEGDDDDDEQDEDSEDDDDDDDHYSITTPTGEVVPLIQIWELKLNRISTSISSYFFGGMIKNLNCNLQVKVHIEALPAHI